MSNETRQALKTALVAALCVAALTALAWWSVVGMVFVGLAALLGLAVGWSLGHRQALSQGAPVRPARCRQTSERLRGGRKP